MPLRLRKSSFDSKHPRDSSGKFLPKGVAATSAAFDAAIGRRKRMSEHMHQAAAEMKAETAKPRLQMGATPSARSLSHRDNLTGNDIESLFANIFGNDSGDGPEHHHEFDTVKQTAHDRQANGIEPQYWSVKDPEKELSEDGVQGLLDYQAPNSYNQMQRQIRNGETGHGSDPSYEVEGQLGEALISDIAKHGKSQKGRDLWRVMDFNTAKPDWENNIANGQPFAVKSPQLFSLGEERGTAEMIGDVTHIKPATFKVHVESTTKAIDTAAWWNGRQAPEVIYPPGTTLEYRGTPQNGDGSYDLFLI